MRAGASARPSAGAPRPAAASDRRRRWRWVAGALLVVTLAQLVLGAVSDLPQFAGKGFTDRLVTYPLLMLALPVVAGVRARRVAGARVPWPACVLLMAPFAIDVAGNTADLYDSVGWWDDANHFLNWLLLCSGLGLLLRAAGVAPRWALGLCVAGVGALLAVGWELAEYLTFIRFGTELAGAYRDTLGDLALGCSGALVAGAVTARRSRSSAGGCTRRAGLGGL